MPSEFNTIKNQLSRLLSALKGCPVTTIMAREELGIMHPAGRIRSLRNKGYKINMTLINATTADGICHKVGEYTLSNGEHING